MFSAMTWLGRASVAAVVCTALASTASADSFGSGANQFDIDFVTIPGSAGDGYGGQSAGVGFTTTNIAHDYRIGVCEITNDQWNKFKNEYGTVNGSPWLAYTGSPFHTGANVPTNNVSWYEAAQFVNWLNTSTGHQPAYKFTGTQGTSSYTLDTWSAGEADNDTNLYRQKNLYRHKDAFYYLPTENEWVKAGYWNGTSLQTYANASSGDLVWNEPDPTKWNYSSSAGNEPWYVGSGAEELNGTFDMMGNVWEWMESQWSDPSFGTGSSRGLRGGSFVGDVHFQVGGYGLASSNRYNDDPGSEVTTVGFRVASEVPEPASIGLLAIGGLALLRWRKQAVKALLVLFAAGLFLMPTTASADSFGSGANQFDIDFVTIPGSAGDGYGGQSAGVGFTTTNIAHDYRIGVYEVTNDQWNKFQDEYGAVTGTPSSAYDESPDFTGVNVPTNNVSWYEAAQFVNWLNTSTGHQPAYKFTGTQGTSGYTFDTWSTAEADNGTNLYRHKDAFYYLPTEDEWVKAGYWNGTNLQTYATPDDTLPVEDVEANYGWDNPSEPWDVGSGAEELNGTYGMMGNVGEWTESPSNDPSFGNGSLRGLGGGSFINNDDFLASWNRGHSDPSAEDSNDGFRVASEVPEPASLTLLALGGLALIRRRKA